MMVSPCTRNSSLFSVYRLEANAESMAKTRMYHLRADDELLDAAEAYAKSIGYSSLAPFIREILAFQIGRPDLSDSGKLSARSKEIRERTENLKKKTRRKSHETD